MALEDALHKVRKAEDRLERQQQKLEEEQRAHELLLKEQIEPVQECAEGSVKPRSRP